MFENLQLECRALKKEISTLDKKCEVEMEKRFGTGVSLETLESFAVNRTLEEMKEASRMKEKAMWKIQNKREEDIKDSKYSLHEHVIRNTKLLKKRTAAFLAKQSNSAQSKKTLELMSRNRMKAASDQDDERELGEMIEIFQQQSLEIMELKALLVRYVMKVRQRQRMMLFAVYSALQYSTVQYSTVQYSTVQYSTVQYSTVQYSTVL